MGDYYLTLDSTKLKNLLQVNCKFSDYLNTHFAVQQEFQFIEPKSSDQSESLPLIEDELQFTHQSASNS